MLAELDYLISNRVGYQAQMALIGDVRRGAYQLEPFPSEDLGHARRIMERWSFRLLPLDD